MDMRALVVKPSPKIALHLKIKFETNVEVYGPCFDIGPSFTTCPVVPCSDTKSQKGFETVPL